MYELWPELWYDSPHDLKRQLLELVSGISDRDWLCAKGSGPSMSDMTALTIWNAIYVISKYDVLDRDWLYAKGSGQAWVTWQPSQLETPST